VRAVADHHRCGPGHAAQRLGDHLGLGRAPAVEQRAHHVVEGVEQREVREDRARVGLGLRRRHDEAPAGRPQRVEHLGDPRVHGVVELPGHPVVRPVGQHRRPGALGVHAALGHEGVDQRRADEPREGLGRRLGRAEGGQRVAHRGQDAGAAGRDRAVEVEQDRVGVGQQAHR
jgi:hypothetical protein